MNEHERIRARARRAALAVTLALGMGGASGCYMDHTEPPDVDAGALDDAAVARTDAGYDAGVTSDCVPDPDCNGPWDGAGDGTCDWDQFNACCDARSWDIEPCWLPGGPLSPPEMPA